MIKFFNLIYYFLKKYNIITLVKKMSKILITLNNTKLIQKSLDKVSGYVIGIKGFCVNYPSFNLDEV